MSQTIFKTSVSSALLHTSGVVNECKFTKGGLLYNLSVIRPEPIDTTFRTYRWGLRDVV